MLKNDFELKHLLSKHLLSKPTHPYSLYGQGISIKKISKGLQRSAQSFYNNFYYPSNFTLVISSNVKDEYSIDERHRRKVVDTSKFKDGLMKEVYKLVDRFIPNAFIPEKDINPVMNKERFLSDVQ